MSGIYQTHTLVIPRVIAKDGVNPTPTPRMTMAEYAALEMKAASERDLGSSTKRYRAGGVPELAHPNTAPYQQEEMAKRRAILHAYVIENPGQLLSEISQTLGMNYSTASNQLMRLVSDGILVRDCKMRYTVGDA